MRHEPLTSNTSVFPGAGEMAKHVRPVKCLPYRHDDLDSDPWSHVTAGCGHAHLET